MLQLPARGGGVEAVGGGALGGVGGGGGGGLCGDGNLWYSLIFQRSDIRGRGDCARRLALDGAAEIF